jgi:hypothetical protein
MARMRRMKAAPYATSRSRIKVAWRLVPATGLGQLTGKPHPATEARGVTAAGSDSQALDVASCAIPTELGVAIKTGAQQHRSDRGEDLRSRVWPTDGWQVAFGFMAD